jgi:hypothetical protein
MVSGDYALRLDGPAAQQRYGSGFLVGCRLRWELEQWWSKHMRHKTEQPRQKTVCGRIVIQKLKYNKKSRTIGG